MPFSIYEGTVTIPLETGVKIEGDDTRLFEFNPFDTPILWEGPVPPFLQGKTIRLIGGHQQTYSIRIKAKRTIKVHIGGDSNGDLRIESITERETLATILLTAKEKLEYDYKSPFVSISGIPYGIKVTITESHSIEGAKAYVTINEFSLTLRIIKAVACNYFALTTPECLEICAADAKSCFTDMLEYCFAPHNPKYGPIGESEVCQNYFATYEGTYGPDARLDKMLTTYCTLNYEGIGELLKAPPTAQRLCACHMQLSQYQAFKSSVLEKYPGFNIPSLTPQCLFAPCVVSPFKSLESGSPCALPQCLNIVNIDLSGNVSGADISIVQNIECSKYDKEVTTDNNDTKKDVRVIIAIAILVFLLLMLIIFLIYFIYISFSDTGKPSS